MQSPPQNKNLMIGSLMVLAAAITISSKAIIVKLAYVYHVNPETLITLRLLFCAPFFIGMAIWATLRNGGNVLTGKDMWMLAVVGVVGGYCPMWLDFAGLAYVSAGLERIILFLYPTMVVLISAYFYKRRIGRYEVFALIVSYLGVGLVVGHDISILKTGSQQTIIGALLVFCSSVVYAAYIVMSGQMIKRLGVSLFTAYTMLAATLASSVHFIANNSASIILHQPHQVYYLSLLMAVVATALPAVLMNLGIKHLGSSHSSLISSVGPVSTIFLAYLFLGEAITSLQLIGTGLVLLGVVTITMRPQERVG